jgi:flagellar basal-body rod modification protein FlgD
MTTTVNNTTTAAATTKTGNANTPAAAQKGLNADYDQFLKLLTTQLANQDPTEPLDTNQITQQIAQLSQVQQAINTNTKLDKLISVFNAAQGSNAVSYIGKQVDVSGNQLEVKAGNGAIVYNLPDGAASANVVIRDNTGKTVFSGPGTFDKGRNQVLWNALNSDGSKVPDGVYTFTVDAKDSKGAKADVTTYTTGTVTAVETQNGTNKLALGRISVPLESVQSIYAAGTNPQA